MTAVAFTRRFAGIGDWLMSLAVLKMAQRQHPDVELYVSFVTPLERMPAIVPQAFYASDVFFKVGEPSWPCLRSEHLVYSRRSPKTFIADMVDVFGKQTGLTLEHEPDLFPTFRFPRPVMPGGYIAMVSHGKRRTPGKKEWGSANFIALAEILAAAGHEIVQIGGADSEPLPAARRRLLGASFGDVAQTLAGARLFIGLEDGVTVLAGFLGVPQVTLYCGAGFPDRLRFARHTQIRELVTPDAAASKVFACI